VNSTSQVIKRNENRIPSILNLSLCQPHVGFQHPASWQQKDLYFCEDSRLKMYSFERKEYWSHLGVGDAPVMYTLVGKCKNYKIKLKKKNLSFSFLQWMP
jgi:hypothetical protein